MDVTIIVPTIAYFVVMTRMTITIALAPKQQTPDGFISFF
jgi:hypothetical protein